MKLSEGGGGARTRLRVLFGPGSAIRRILPRRVRRELRRLVQGPPYPPIVPVQVRAVEQPPAPVEQPVRPAPPIGSVRLLVGPANFAGQGYLWARSAQRYLTDVGSQSFAFLKGRLDFPVDYAIPLRTYGSREWQREQEAYVRAHFTHVLIEAMRPVFGSLHGRDCSGDMCVLRDAGITVGLLAHGSDVRLPSRHAERYPWSPFRDADWELVPNLEGTARQLGKVINDYDGPRFVSTPDLVDDVPGALWLPTVVDVDRWRTNRPVLARRRPIVVHAPSKSRIKGSDLVDPIAESLAEQGVIEYRRIENASPEEMPAIYQTADVVLDQFRLGSYGVAACEAMAAGRAVVGHVAPAIRERVKAYTGSDLPVIEATPDTLEQVLFAIARRPDWAQRYASAGTRYVRAVHDGQLAAWVLAGFLGRPPRTNWQVRTLPEQQDNQPYSGAL